MHSPLQSVTSESGHLTPPCPCHAFFPKGPAHCRRPPSLSFPPALLLVRWARTEGWAGTTAHQRAGDSSVQDTRPSDFSAILPLGSFLFPPSPQAQPPTRSSGKSSSLLPLFSPLQTLASLSPCPSEKNLEFLLHHQVSSLYLYPVCVSVLSRVGQTS